MPLVYLSETVAREVTRQQAVTEAVSALYVAMASGTAWHYPVVRGPLGAHDAIFGFKSGYDGATGALGLKAGGLWPGNMARGLANHQSTTLLFDPETGLPTALVRAAWLTALRTAAASALGVRHLARQDAATLGIIGAGGQAAHQLRAVLPERAFSRLMVHDADAGRAETLAREFSAGSLAAEAADAETLVRRSDVVITVTPAFGAIVRADWARPGQHYNCMGADTRGKQEVEAGLVARARLFVDDPEQAATIGECQHAVASGQVRPDDLTAIGHVIGGLAAGRSNDMEISLFDSTGVGLQDVVAAEVALAAARSAGRLVLLDD